MSELTIPPSIPFSSVIFGDRARSTYDNIDLLAESIRTAGLQCPIILSPLPDGSFLLEDGGRRYQALDALGVTELFHGETGTVGKPGFVVKAHVSTGCESKLTELIANLHRDQLDWRDEVKLLVQAYRIRKLEADRVGEDLFYTTFGKMVGNYGYADINAAMCIHDELVANPALFKECNGIQAAYRVLLKESQKAAQAELVKKTTVPTATPVQAEPKLELIEQPPVSAPPPPRVIDLGARFFLGDSYAYMAGLPAGSFDHVICDPDFAVSVDRLESNVAGAAAGVAQSSVEDSLTELRNLFPAAFRVMKTHGFLLLWCDLDHWEKLQDWATLAGFAVQRWPLIWHKPDFRSNASPQTNFCKNIEYAMVCRKPGTVLASVQTSSVITHPTGQFARNFGHPFSKPLEVWTKIFSAVATKGQSVLDPFMGAGSSCVAAVRFGLDSFGCELSPDHYNSAILNLRKEYSTLLGSNVLFS